MKVIQTNNKTWCFVGVPEDAKEIKVRDLPEFDDFLSYMKDGNEGRIPLPPGTWSIFADSKTITEEQAAQVVERNICGYEDYSTRKLSVETGCVVGIGSALISFGHLRDYHNPVGRQIILELLKNEK
jgi:hypothetical protein